MSEEQECGCNVGAMLSHVCIYNYCYIYMIIYMLLRTESVGYVMINVILVYLSCVLRPKSETPPSGPTTCAAGVLFSFTISF